MPVKSLFKSTDYALGVSSMSGEQVDQQKLQDIFKRAALRNGMQVSTSTEYDSKGTTDTVITFNVPENTPFTDMSPVLDIVRDAVKGAVVVSLTEDIEGKKFAQIKEDRLNRMYKESILSSMYRR